jgi:aminobenzoyl-glutamate utilization protein B
MVHAAKAMGRTAQMLLADAGLLAEAKAEHARRLAKTPYVCPLPPDLKAPILPRT